MNEAIDLPEVTTRAYWVQLEHRFWDAAPLGVDRLTGQTIEQLTGKAPVLRALRRPDGSSEQRTMYLPLDAEVLIYRRCSSGWVDPADVKVNPWDINEPDPTDTGTMGTIPGLTIECNLGEEVVVHFRNHDFRQIDPFDPKSSLLDIESRTHSMHAHGFVFAPQHDGAYPLSPPDLTQPVGDEAAAWEEIGVTSGYKHGDRVPPGCTFTYHWRTMGWPTTAGVWLYHDHSICDMENVQLGAIGHIVIHNPNDPNDVGVLRTQPIALPPVAGSPIRWTCGEVAGTGGLTVDAGSLSGLGQVESNPRYTDVAPRVARTRRAIVRTEAHTHERATGSTGMDTDTTVADQSSTAGHTHEHASAPDSTGHAHASAHTHVIDDAEATAGHNDGDLLSDADATACDHCGDCESCETCEHCDHDVLAPIVARTIQRGAVAMELLFDAADQGHATVGRMCFPVFRAPPDEAQYLLIYHNLGSAGMCVNGRKYLGNTPTLVAGDNTKMRFGVVGMGNVDGFHTFHIHGHRWILPGPHGTDRATIEGSAQVAPMTPFEDTRVFGPASSFAFTIDPASSGTLMRADPPFGEWHMHCHVLVHMMDGMMGSLLIVKEGQVAPPLALLPVGVPCPTMSQMPGGGHHDPGYQPRGARSVAIQTQSFEPSVLYITAGETVTWTNMNGLHTVTHDAAGTKLFDSSPVGKSPLAKGETFSFQFIGAGTYGYYCRLHPSMKAKIEVLPNPDTTQHHPPDA